MASQYAETVNRAYIRDGWKCRICKTRLNLTPHHIVFRSQGGKDTTENILTLCIECHDKVHGRELFILSRIDGQPPDANKGIKIKCS